MRDLKATAPVFDWWNGTVAGALDHLARCCPDSEAIVHNDRRLTYREFSERATAVACGLASLGIRQGDHVGILHPNHLNVQILHYAVARLGAVYVPFNISLSAADLRQLVAHSEVSVLLVGGAYRETPLINSLAAALPELRTPPGAALRLPGHPKLRTVFNVGHGLTDLERLGTRTTLPPHDGTNATDISHIVYTSGSTRLPKGARLRHRGVLGAAFYWGEALCLTASDRFLVTLPFCHTGGLFLSALSVLLRGGCLHITDRFEEREVLEIVRRERITAMGALDYQLRRMAKLIDAGGYDISSWTKSYSQAASYQLRARLGIKHIVCFYAMTEASNPVALVMPDEHRESIRSASNGRPLPGVEVRIVDPGSGTQLGPMVKGEIRFRGWNCFAGYHNPCDDDLPARVFDADGFFRTGDCGYLDDEGYLWLTGRYKDMIKSGGENVSALEVEDWIVNHVPGVEAAKVVGVPDERWGEAVTAFIELRPGAALAPDEIIDQCKGRLSAYKIPKHVFLVNANEWPVSSAEMIKVRKDVLRARAQSLIAEERVN